MTASTKKNNQLGQPFGTANNQLKKELLYSLVSRLGLNICFRCDEPITDSRQLSVDHKIDWIDSENPKQLFFDLNNIAFSHLSCNCRAGTGGSKNKITSLDDKRIKHGTDNAYTKFGCRCESCKEAKSLRNKKRVRK